MTNRLLQWLGGRRRACAGPFELRVLTAWELLQARREAKGLEQEALEAGLCLNACVLARAASVRGRAVFSSGQQVLMRLSAETIETLSARYAALSQRQRRRLQRCGRIWPRAPMSGSSGGCCGSSAFCPLRRAPGR